MHQKHPERLLKDDHQQGLPAALAHTVRVVRVVLLLVTVVCDRRSEESEKAEPVDEPPEAEPTPR